MGAYHVIARCVRRAWLCGADSATGKNFEHRKAWVRDRMEELAGVMAVEVLGFSVLCDH